MFRKKQIMTKCRSLYFRLLESRIFNAVSMFQLFDWKVFLSKRFDYFFLTMFFYTLLAVL